MEDSVLEEGQIEENSVAPPTEAKEAGKTAPWKKTTAPKAKPPQLLCSYVMYRGTNPGKQCPRNGLYVTGDGNKYCLNHYKSAMKRLDKAKKSLEPKPEAAPEKKKVAPPPSKPEDPLSNDEEEEPDSDEEGEVSHPQPAARFQRPPTPPPEPVKEDEEVMPSAPQPPLKKRRIHFEKQVLPSSSEEDVDDDYYSDDDTTEEEDEEELQKWKAYYKDKFRGKQQKQAKKTFKPYQEVLDGYKYKGPEHALEKAQQAARTMNSAYTVKYPLHNKGMLGGNGI